MFYGVYTPQYFGEYTGVVEDLVDGIDAPWSYDWVEGYTMDQIEKALELRFPIATIIK